MAYDKANSSEAKAAKQPLYLCHVKVFYTDCLLHEAA
jgi:hypothetical protein